MKPITTILLSLIVLVLSCKVSEPETVKSTKKEITSLQISGIANATTTYDEPTKTYTITVPTGTNIKALTLALNLPTGATSVPATGSVLDFTNPIVCTITAEDGSTQKYTIRVVVQAAPKSSQKQLLSFSFDELNPVVKATINQTTFEITAEIPATANLKALKPNITLSDKASVSPTSGAAQDFTNAVKYTVTAEDGSKQEYAVTVKQVNQSTSTQIWDKAFGGSGSDGLGSMIATPDGGFLLGGGSRSRTSGNKTATNYGDFDNTNCWVVKINANGEMVWDKAFGGSGYNGDFLRSMIATSDGGFLLGGDLVLIN
ncbi:MAG: DUF5018 domain-containing protein [Cytophagales bacterium]|nr:MAG: DUF5018 domain-containing protein [Cytophagales bacterium]